MSWIQTYTGRKIDLRDEKFDICIEDIAHALSNICRFTGHTKRFYSVAEHSAFMVLALETDMGIDDLETLKWALLHDASEAYLADVSKPFKDLIGEEYKAFDKRLTKAIQDHFDVHPSFWQEQAVHLADVRMLVTERDQLLGTPPQPWSANADPFKLKLEAMAPVLAEEYFLSTYNYLFDAKPAAA